MTKNKNNLINVASNTLNSLNLPNKIWKFRRLSGRNNKIFTGVMSYYELLSIVKPNDTHEITDSFMRSQRPTDMPRAIRSSRLLHESYLKGQAKSMPKITLAIRSNQIKITRNSPNNEVEMELKDKASICDGSHRTLGPAAVLAEGDRQYTNFLNDYEVEVELAICDSHQEMQQGFLDANSGVPVRFGTKTPIEESIRNGLSYRVTRRNYDWSKILGTTTTVGHLFVPSVFTLGVTAFEKVLQDKKYSEQQIDEAFDMFLSKLTPFTDRDFVDGVDNHRTSHVLFASQFWRSLCKIAGVLFVRLHGDINAYERELEKIFSNFENNTLWKSADNTWRGVIFDAMNKKITGANYHTLSEKFLAYKFRVFNGSYREKQALTKMIRAYSHRKGDVLGQPWR